jgi:hypothetical protein
MSYGIQTTTPLGDSMVILGDLPSLAGQNSQPFATPEAAWDEHEKQLGLLPSGVTAGWTSQLVELVPVGEAVPL